MQKNMKMLTNKLLPLSLSSSTHYRSRILWNSLLNLKLNQSSFHSSPTSRTTTPTPVTPEPQFKIVKTVGQPPQNPDIKKYKELSQLCEPKHYLKTQNLGTLSSGSSYVLQGFLAELEQALIRYTVDHLRKENFQLISVPDFLYRHVIEGCGFPTTGERNQVYQLETEENEEPLFLSGTAEMGIAAFLSGKTFDLTDLPLKLASVSRCHRAETSSIEDERGIYRVHSFTKVEMFGVTPNETGTESQDMHLYIRNIQEKLFTDLGLHFQIVDMPPEELGASASSKFDIEAWMPGRAQFGEISSCSDCRDYQSSHLNIQYKSNTGSSTKFVHTVNGTACAIPRMIIALVETGQDSKGDVQLPSVLQPYMYHEWNSNHLKKPNAIFLKNKTQQEKVKLEYDEWMINTS